MMLSVSSSNHSRLPAARVDSRRRKAGNRVGEEDEAFDPPADDQKTPAVVAGHVVHRETGQR
jgi:hypothetical protein